MVRTTPTRVGKIFITLMLLLYVACVTSQSGLLLLFIGLMAGCFAVNWSFSRRNARNILIEAPRKETLVEGSPAIQPWRITNKTKKHIELVEIHSETGLLFRVPFLRTGESLALVPNLVYQKRGVYPHNHVFIFCSAPYGLLRSTHKVKLQGEVIVLPRIYETDSPSTAGLDLISGGKIKGRRRVNSGNDFAGVRSWQPGDTLKQVHWKSSARREELMVKTFEEELGGRISIVIDGRTTGNRKQSRKNKPPPIRFGNKHVYLEVNPDSKLARILEKWFRPAEVIKDQKSHASPDRLDDCLRAAASIATAALQEGHHLEIVESLAVEHLRLAPFSDEGELLERLARYSPNFPSLEIEELWRRSSILLIGLEWQEEWDGFVQDARRQHRAITVYLPAGTLVPSDVPVELFWFKKEMIEADWWKERGATC